MSYINDHNKLILALARFKVFVNSKDKKYGPISFRDNNCFLGREEDFKSIASVEARKELKLDKWKESNIGKGEIGECVINALKKCGNLVNANQKNTF